MISLIIPHYKDIDRLLQLLKQLEDQTLSKDFWEVIVVNNDQEVPLTVSEDFFVLFRFQILEEPKPGSYAARNKGISDAKGSVIAFTDSDCLPDEDWLKNAWDVFSQDFKNEIGILTGPVSLFFNDPNHLTDAEVYEKYTGFTTEVYAKEGHAITANWFSYKSVLEEFGQFNAELKSNGDSELSGKISKKYPIVFEDNIIVRHPARYSTLDLVNKYRRLLGGTFTRKYQHDLNGFRWFVFNFVWKRYRFAFKKLLTVSTKESIAIWRVCHAISLGSLKEYIDLKKGSDPKR